jgi:tellurite resistance protein TehA-like permease
VAIYVVTSGLVAARLLRAGLGQQDDTAPYWVAMGAASLAVLGAAGILSLRAPAALAMGRPVITGIAVALWILATGLIPVLLGRAAWRHLRWRVPLRYRADLWVVVFPAGMYATAGIQFGTAAALPVVRDVGLAAAWAAAGAWTVTFAAMIISPLRRSRLPAAPLA